MKFYHVIALILWANLSFATESTSTENKDLDLILSYYDQYASDRQPDMKDFDPYYREGGENSYRVMTPLKRLTQGLKEEDFALFLRILKHPHVPTSEKEYLVEKMIGIGTRSEKNYKKWVKEPLYPYFEQTSSKTLATTILKRLGSDDTQKKLNTFKLQDEVDLLAISISYRERDIKNFLDPLISEAGYYLARNIRTNHPLHADYFIKKVPFTESDFFLQFKKVFDLDTLEEPMASDLVKYLIELLSKKARTTSTATRLIEYLEVLAKRFPKHQLVIKKAVTDYFKEIDDYYTLMTVEKNMKSILGVLGVDNVDNAIKIKKSELLSTSQAPGISAGAESAQQSQEVEDSQLANDSYWESLATPDKIGQYYNEVKIRLMRPAYQGLENQVNLAKRIDRYGKLIRETEDKKKAKYYDWILSLLKNSRMENSVKRSMRDLIFDYYKKQYTYELNIKKNYKGETYFTQDGQNPQSIMALPNRSRYFEGIRYQLLKNEDELKAKFLPKIDEILTNSSFPDAQSVALSFYSNDVVFESLGRKNIQGIESECSDEYCAEGGIRDKVIEIYQYWAEKFKTADIQRNKREIGFFDPQYTQPREILREAVLILAKLTEQKDEKSRRFLSELSTFERTELFSVIPGRTLDAISDKIAPQLNYNALPGSPNNAAEPARQR